MDIVLRSLTVYFAMVLIFRISGNRTLKETTMFDFVLLLIISESTQEALVGGNRSVTGSIVVTVTLIFTDIILSFAKQYSKKIDKILDGMPLVLVEDGKYLKQRMNKVRIDEDDILESARILRGLEKVEQIKYAILERDGDISIIPQN